MECVTFRHITYVRVYNGIKIYLRMMLMCKFQPLVLTFHSSSRFWGTKFNRDYNFNIYILHIMVYLALSSKMIVFVSVTKPSTPTIKLNCIELILYVIHL